MKDPVYSQASGPVPDSLLNVEMTAEKGPVQYEKRKEKTGTIVAIVIGAITLLLIVAIFVYCHLRRRRAYKSQVAVADDSSADFQDEPVISSQ